MCGRLSDMKHLPFPLRVAAGLAVTTAERVRDLPKQLTEFPVTVASQVLQTSMRVQQQVTELAIKGDDALSALRPVEDTPSWATFDEDEPDLEPDIDPDMDTEPAVPLSTTRTPESNGHRQEPVSSGVTAAARDDDPWAQEERALGELHTEGEFDSTSSSDTPVPGARISLNEGSEGSGGRAEGTAYPAGLADYDQLTLPQVRSRLRSMSLAELEELLAYEREHANRPSFTGMLSRRINNVRQQADADDTGDPTDR